MPTRDLPQIIAAADLLAARVCGHVLLHPAGIPVSETAPRFCHVLHFSRDRATQSSPDVTYLEGDSPRPHLVDIAVNRTLPIAEDSVRQYFTRLRDNRIASDMNDLHAEMGCVL